MLRKNTVEKSARKALIKIQIKISNSRTSFFGIREGGEKAALERAKQAISGPWAGALRVRKNPQNPAWFRTFGKTKAPGGACFYC